MQLSDKMILKSRLLKVKLYISYWINGIPVYTMKTIVYGAVNEIADFFAWRQCIQLENK